MHTDAGVSGLGETSYAAHSVETYLHEYVAPRVLGRDPLEIEALSRSLAGYLGWRGSGVETISSEDLEICAAEILAGRGSFKDLLETGVAGIVMFDLAWCGGISEARRIAALADAWQLPVAPHECTGPVVAPNAPIQESVRAFYTGWYNELVTHVPQPVQGYFGKPPGPGIGTELLPELWRRNEAVIRVSTA